ncbi:hypothetical protein [Burkholderia vietnamiensis]|uniref:hypothetical protein n=1 Tax=Burkholderia vietnamiensis TaxID=60552 RepID=UPI00158A427A|nr:hypothetical protein [Burkholderia vietnamiensis]MCA8183841.1 hypothetical protein [Burkholderia vietnamiensis]
MTTLVLSVPGETTDASLPTLAKDAIINAGSMFLFDFLHPDCNANAVGALSAGATFSNLVDGKPVGSVAGAGGDATLTNTGGGLSFAGTTGARFVDLGKTYAMAAVNHPNVVIAWAKAVAPVNNSGVVSLGSAIATRQYTIEASSAGASMAINGQNGGGSFAMPAGASQFALAWSPTGILQAFINNTLVAQVKDDTVLIDYSAYSTRVGVDPATVMWKGMIYRVYQEDLAVSGMTAAAVVANDFAANNGRFA